MKTIQTYMVRKPADIDEVKAITRANINRLETVVVVETVHLPPAWHAAVCQRPMDNYPFLSGKGGYTEENMRKVIALQCPGRPTLYVDPSGSSYCRYMGIEVEQVAQQ